MRGWFVSPQPELSQFRSGQIRSDQINTVRQSESQSVGQKWEFRIRTHTLQARKRTGKWVFGPPIGAEGAGHLEEARSTGPNGMGCKTGGQGTQAGAVPAWSSRRGGRLQGWLVVCSVCLSVVSPVFLFRLIQQAGRLAGWPFAISAQHKHKHSITLHNRLSCATTFTWPQWPCQTGMEIPPVCMQAMSIDEILTCCCNAAR